MGIPRVGEQNIYVASVKLVNKSKQEGIHAITFAVKAYDAVTAFQTAWEEGRKVFSNYMEQNKDLSMMIELAQQKGSPVESIPGIAVGTNIRVQH